MLSEDMLTLALLPADPVLRIALYSSVALVAITLLVMLQVLMLSELAMRRARRRMSFNEHWRNRFAACTLGLAEGERPEALPPNQRLWFLLQWSRFQQHLRGTAHDRMNELLIAMGMEQHALTLLASDGIRARLVALTTLRHVADPTHWETIERQLDADNHAISLAAAQALIAIAPERAITRLLSDVTLGGNRWSIAQLAGLCRQAGNAAVTAPLLEALERGDARSRRRLASLIAFAVPQSASPWARRILSDHSSAEEMRAALRCLQDAADPRDRANIVKALAHEDPDVRLAALGAFRRIATREDAPRLLELLADRSWWVRQAAADALVALPGTDAQRLAEWLASVDDAYGRDALRRAMAEARS